MLSCSMCMMASIRCSGSVLQALSESGSEHAPWPLSAVLLTERNVRDFAQETTSWHPCCVKGLTVF